MQNKRIFVSELYVIELSWEDSVSHHAEYFSHSMIPNSTHRSDDRPNPSPQRSSTSCRERFLSPRLLTSVLLNLIWRQINSQWIQSSRKTATDRGVCVCVCVCRDVCVWMCVCVCRCVCVCVCMCV